MSTQALVTCEYQFCIMFSQDVRFARLSTTTFDSQVNNKVTTVSCCNFNLEAVIYATYIIHMKERS